MPFIDTILIALIAGGFYALISIGINLQYGVARILNLAYGEAMMLAAFATFFAFASFDLPPLVSLLVTAPVAFVLNYLLFQGLFRPLVRRAKSQGALEVDSILSTFGLVFFLQGLALLALGGSDRAYSYLARPVEILGAVISANRLLAFVAAIAIGGGVYAVLRHTRFGLAVRSIASSIDSAPLVGIDVQRYSGFAFALGGMTAAIAGALVSSFININPTIGTEYTMKALIVVTMGGIGNIMGGVAAGLLLGLAETVGARLIDPGLITAINFIVFILVLLVRPQGLFGKAR